MADRKKPAPAARKPEPAAADEGEANVRGEVTVELDGQQYHLRPSRLAIENIEAKTGRSLTELVALSNLERLQLTLRECAISVAEMMNAYGRSHEGCPGHSDYAGAKPDRCADLIYEAGIPKVQARLWVVFVAALTGGVDASGEARPAKEKLPPSAG
jgi:hypothetical protein